MRNRIIRFWCQTQVLFLGVMLLPGAVWSQTAPIEGVRTNTPQVHALINARIVQQPGKVVEKGTVVLRDGVIASVGENVTLPADARVWDCEGLTIYPGLIETYSHLGVMDTTPKESGARHWNASVRCFSPAWDN